MKAFIEMISGDKEKWELNKEVGLLMLSRTLDVAVPTYYGFIPNTLAPDGDDIDVFVSSSLPIPQGSQVEIEVVGVYECLDGGVRDDKILAVVKGDSIKVEADAILTYLLTYKPGFEV